MTDLQIPNSSHDFNYNVLLALVLPLSSCRLLSTCLWYKFIEMLITLSGTFSLWVSLYNVCQKSWQDPGLSAFCTTTATQNSAGFWQVCLTSSKPGLSVMDTDQSWPYCMCACMILAISTSSTNTTSTCRKSENVEVSFGYNLLVLLTM
jgi:hypothetical protein